MMLCVRFAVSMNYTIVSWIDRVNHRTCAPTFLGNMLKPLFTRLGASSAREPPQEYMSRSMKVRTPPPPPTHHTRPTQCLLNCLQTIKICYIQSYQKNIFPSNELEQKVSSKPLTLAVGAICQGDVILPCLVFLPFVARSPARLFVLF